MGAKVATFEQCYNAEKRRRLQNNPRLLVTNVLRAIFCTPEDSVFGKKSKKRT